MKGAHLRAFLPSGQFPHPDNGWQRYRTLHRPFPGSRHGRRPDVFPQAGRRQCLHLDLFLAAEDHPVVHGEVVGGGEDPRQDRCACHVGQRQRLSSQQSAEKRKEDQVQDAGGKGGKNILDEFGDSVDSSIIGIIQSFDGTERKSLKRSMQEILKFVENWNNENQLGNKHRKKYFEDINLEIERDSRLSRFLKITGLNERQLANLIGNISNLQLRGLRRYFSSENKQPVTVFDPEKLKNAFIYNLNYNHKDNNNRDHWNEIQKAKQLFKTNSVIEVLKELDPCATIPCYEDMNNRNPPKDQTLLLNPDVLNKEYLNWKVWVDRIVDDYKYKEQFQIDYNIEHIYKLTDRKSRIPVQVGGVYVKKDDENYKYSYLLQRIMDRTISADPYRIKSLCKNSRSQIAIQNAESKERCDNGRLRRLLGENEFAQFMIFADKYYKEVDSARAGCWLLTDSSLFELSNINPPKKNSHSG